MSSQVSGVRRKGAASARNAGPVAADTKAAAAYAALVRRFVGQPGITVPDARRGKFGSNALKVDGKIFAMLVKGALAVKLPPGEVESATAAGRGEPLTMGRGRVMKEWLLLHEAPRRWYATAERARAFVAQLR